MNKSKRIQAFWLAVIMAFLPCCTAFAEAMPGVATGNDLPAVTEEPPVPTETATKMPAQDAATEELAPTEQPTPAAEDEAEPPVETEITKTQTTEEPTVTPPAPLPAQAGDLYPSRPILAHFLA